MLELTSARPAPPPGPYLVAGLGRAGMAAIRALASIGPGPIQAWDAAETPATQAAATQAESLGARVQLGGDGRRLLARRPVAATIIRSPGIPITDPLLRAARERDITVIDELELGWRLDRRPFVAVTGTNGKSTVAAMIAAALTAAGRRPMIAGNTQVGPPVSGLAAAAADVVVAEVSSFQLEACPSLLPEAAAFTNLSEDHLDRHGSMARYERCKRRLFLRPGACVPVAAVNVADPAGLRLARDLRRAGGDVASAGTGQRAMYRLKPAAGRSSSPVTVPSGAQLELGPAGSHNAANALLALALARAIGLDEHQAASAIAAAQPPPGRFEPVQTDRPFRAIVDFAHNPAGIRWALEAARAQVQAGGQLRAVIAALDVVTTGEQRRKMGRAAAALADDVIVTSDPIWGAAGCDSVATCLAEAAGRCAVIPDRAHAITEAVQRARPGDVVIVLGRGMRVELADGSKFDDRAALRDAIAQSGTGT